MSCWGSGTLAVWIRSVRPVSISGASGLSSFHRATLETVAPYRRAMSSIDSAGMTLCSTQVSSTGGGGRALGLQRQRLEGGLFFVGDGDGCLLRALPGLRDPQPPGEERHRCDDSESDADPPARASTGIVERIHPENMTAKNKARFDSLRDATFKVARAWAMKEVALGLWNYKSRGWARRGWESLISWMSRSRLGPMVKVAKMLRTHLWGIINAIVLKATNADLESTNAKIQALKKRACGYRDRFRHAILFRCGKLDLHPRLATHTVS